MSKYLRALGNRVTIIARCWQSSGWTYSSWTSLPSRLWFLIYGTVTALKADVDIIEGTNFTNYPIAWLAGLLRRKPVVFCYHDVFIGEWVKNVGPIGIVGEIAERVILSLPVNGYIAVSESTRKKLAARGISPEKITVLHNGIDPSEFHDLPGTPKRADIVCVNRLVSYKRTVDLIKAVNLLTSKFPNIRVLIIGQGPERPRLENLVKESGLAANVSFLGFVPSHREVLQTMAQAKIFCSPSIVEGFGISVIEAAFLGVPAVLTDIPAFREVTDNGQGALLFRPKSASDLSVKLIDLLSHPTLYREKSRQAKLLSKKYSWSDLAKKLASLYEKQ